jgi:serine/threonine-protein phosphatase 2A activator
MASDSSTAGSLPKLSLLDLTAPHSFVTPAKRIHEGTDVSRFLTSFAYRDIGIFILQLNHALVPRQEPDGKIRTFSLPNAPSSTPSITALQGLLKTVESYIDEAPPDPGPRRFGNVSFRKWHELLDQRIDGLLSDGLLAEALKAGDGTAKKEVASYFKGAWGSSQRLDYGTGHELSFLAFLGCLWKLGYFNDGDTVDDGAMEREVVLAVVEP